MRRTFNNNNLNWFFRGMKLSFVLLSFSLADYTKELDKIAGKLAKDIAKGQRVVVFNILKGNRDETYNSVDLAVKLSMRLKEIGRNKFTVIDRRAGEKLAFEETKYTPRALNSEELMKLLEGFTANIGVLGEYTIVGNKLFLENMRAIAVPSPERPPEVISSVPKLSIRLAPEDSICLVQKDVSLPKPPDSITNYFLTSATNKNFITAKIVDLDGRSLPNDCVKIGSYYRLRIDVKEDGFLYVFSYDQDNNTAYLIYPMNEIENRIINQGQFIIPKGDMAIEAKAPAGNNFVKIFVSRKPIPLIIPSSEDSRMTIEEVKAFVQELKNLSSDDWSSFRIFVHIMD